MSKTRERIDFLNSPAGLELKAKLLRMMGDSKYNTASSYTANNTTYPDNLIPFVDKHLNYLKAHPELDTTMYLANIQLITRVR